MAETGRELLGKCWICRRSVFDPDAWLRASLEAGEPVVAGDVQARAEGDS